MATGYRKCNKVELNERCSPNLERWLSPRLKYETTHSIFDTFMFIALSVQ